MDDQWKKVFCDGLCPQLPTETLHALRKGLAEDDPRLIKGASIAWNDEHKRFDACLIGYCGLCEELTTRDELSEFFVSVCEGMNRRLPAGLFRNAHAPLVYFWDDTPRAVARVAVLKELDRVLAQRATEEVTA